MPDFLEILEKMKKTEGIDGALARLAREQTAPEPKRRTAKETAARAKVLRHMRKRRRAKLEARAAALRKGL